MEKRLYDAAVENDTATLFQLLQQDPALLNKTNVKSEDKNPLHVAATLGNVDFAEAILREEKSAFQYMCLARNRDGKNPLHIAAICGKLGVLRLFLDAVSPAAATEKTDVGETILHLCAKYDQSEVLKLLIDRFKDDKQLLNAQNKDGLTILHQAIYNKQYETVVFLLQPCKLVEVNIQSADGKTALDFLLEQSERNQRMLSLLRFSGAVNSGKIRLTNYWSKTGQDALKVVASLLATMAFQVAVSPPGGVWQDDLLGGPNPHRAGEAVMANTHPKYYAYLLRANTLAFVSSLSAILTIGQGKTPTGVVVLGVLLGIMILMAVAATVTTYTIAIGVLSPSFAGLWNAVGLAIVAPLGVWMGSLVMTAYEVFKEVDWPLPKFGQFWI